MNSHNSVSPCLTSLQCHQIGGKGKTMKQAMWITQWVLGVAGALSLLVGVIFKIAYVTIPGFIPNPSPTGFLKFTAVCSLASIALSLLKITTIMDQQ